MHFFFLASPFNSHSSTSLHEVYEASSFPLQWWDLAGEHHILESTLIIKNICIRRLQRFYQTKAKPQLFHLLSSAVSPLPKHRWWIQKNRETRFRSGLKEMQLVQVYSRIHGKSGYALWNLSGGVVSIGAKVLLFLHTLWVFGQFVSGPIRDTAIMRIV